LTRKRKIFIYLFSITLIGFLIFNYLGPRNYNYKEDIKHVLVTLTTSKTDTIFVRVQPFSDVPDEMINTLFTKLKKIYPYVILNRPIDLPASAYYAPKNRFKADTIICFLRINALKNEKYIGITSKDISHAKGKIKDYGIMGLGFQPGNSCVISSFRISKVNKSEQLFKLAIHELGHNFGLPHCKNSNCYMRDAEGKNHFDEESSLCQNCKKYLIKFGWKL
jgi:archaemetzincin